MEKNIQYQLFYSILILVVNVFAQCDQINEQMACNQNDLCEWNYWSPSLCQFICNQLTIQNQCNDAINCIWQSDMAKCQVKKCTEEVEESKCLKIVACNWADSKCWDSSCIQLKAQEQGKCQTDYCIWDSKRRLCYDKKCSDYQNQYECSQLSFCSWFKYKCRDNGNKKLEF
ncbi:unnamed protein product [Paramecium primaurelia]|uniref:Transmembrane protein n=1 Tax=Paramecium primaurelia TaxID=5886 RepID=A0A8S1K249_PARPR|nr:unnamed protein product [Paramecium primaurelia]